MHWGREYRPRMNGLQRRIATYLTSLGVDVIIGSHPHVMQPYSYRDKRFVAYSLGNLLFSHEWTPEKFRVGYCLFLFFLFFLHCDIRLNLQRTTIAEDSGGRSRVGHYRVPKTLTFKTAESQKWKTVLMISSFICMRTKKSLALHLASIKNRGFGLHGRGLFFGGGGGGESPPNAWFWREKVVENHEFSIETGDWRESCYSWKPYSPLSNKPWNKLTQLEDFAFEKILKSIV